jgi:hypothetical protein
MTELRSIQSKLEEAGAVGFTCYLTADGWMISIKRGSGFDCRPRVSYDFTEAMAAAFELDGPSDDPELDDLI